MEHLAIFVFFTLFTVSFGYTNEQAAQYADADGNGIISDDEFAAWHKMAMEYKKPETILKFVLPIHVIRFRFVLEQWQEKGYFSPDFSVDDAVNYANEDGNDYIDADEFDKWYDGVAYYSAQALSAAMKQGDGVISIEDFINVLNYVPQ